MRVIRASEQPRRALDGDRRRSAACSRRAPRRGTFELYTMDIGGAARHADPHHAGVVEYLLVVEGAVRAGPETTPVELQAGDLLTFPADVPHVYEGLPEAHYVLLMSYP